LNESHKGGEDLEGRVPSKKKMRRKNVIAEYSSRCQRREGKKKRFRSKKRLPENDSSPQQKRRREGKGILKGVDEGQATKWKGQIRHSRDQEEIT